MTAPPLTASALACQRLVHVYGALGAEVVALRDVDLTVEDRETVAVLGPSGAGKSTLLWLAAGLLRPSAGTISVLGRRTDRLPPVELTRLRSHEIGVVLQTPGRNLLPYATATQNVLFGMRGAHRRARARDLLDALGLHRLASRAAGSLSGGEQQRLAVAVAVANRPRLLLADEPTSQLEAASADAVLDLLHRANTDYGSTVVAVTHDPAVAAALGRTVTIRDGRVGAEGRGGTQYVIVGRDGSVQLPPEALGNLPPGSRAVAVPHPDGVDLRRAER